MAIHTFSCVQQGTLLRSWRSELPFKRWHHHTPALVVLLLNSPLNKSPNSQRRVSLFFFSRTQSSSLAVAEADFHWHYNWSPAFILSLSKSCLLTTDLSSPGLMSVLPPFCTSSFIVSAKKSSLVPTSLLMTTWVYVF